MSTEPLFTLPFETIVRRTSERTTYPGGGAACAMACASAASLVAMAARFTGEGAAQALATAESAIQELRHLADEDAAAFGKLLEAWALPADHPERRERVAAAALGACAVPVRICRLGAQIVVSAAWLSTEGKRDLRGDAFTGAQLGLAGVLGAAQLVELNAAQAADDAPAQEVRGLVASTRELVRQLEGTPPS
jgi:formiminotetrahydrofolate cyclodeaminase